MKNVKIYEYYSFGYNYRNLRFAEPEHLTNEEYYKKIFEYVQFVNNLKLRVTKETLIMQGISEDLQKLHKLSKGHKRKKEIVDLDFFIALQAKIDKADTTLDAELNIRTAFILDEKRINNETLLENVSKLFSEKTFELLPDVARYDFEESCKYLVFDRYTACAFHALRGTEDVIKTFYEKITGKVATDSQTWYNFVDEIKSNSTIGTISPAVSVELLTNLDLLRKFYRNKTQHPHLMYNVDDSQDLLTHCIRSVNQIMKEITDRGI